MPRSAAQPLKHFYEVPRDLLSRKGTEVRQHTHGLTGTLIVGDDTGLIKVISCKKKKVIKIWGEQNPVKRIKKLYWAYPQTTHRENNREDLSVVNHSQKEFLAVLSNGDVRCYNSLVGSYKTEIKQEKNIQGLYVMDNPCITDANKRMVWTINGRGNARLWGLGYHKKEYSNADFPHDTMILNKIAKTSEPQNNSKNGNDSFLNLLKSQKKRDCDKHKSRGVLLSSFTVNTSVEKQGTVGANGKRKFDERRKRRIDQTYGATKGDIRCLKGHGLVSQFPWFAIGGNDRPVEVYDFNKQKCIFKGKHHFHHLGHRHAITVNDIDWCKKSVNPYLCAAVTAESEVKLYDLRTEQSVFRQKVGDYALNKVIIKSKKKILVGDANANIWEFDYLIPAKQRGAVYRRFRGFVGAIRDFDIHPTRNLMASVGLGRYVVVHRFNQPHLPLFRTYLKQKLNAVLFATVYDTTYAPEEKKGEEEEDGNESTDVEDFVNDSESEVESAVGNENENAKEVEDGDEEAPDDEEVSADDEWEDKLDGYDTDELKELLHELQGPPLKKQKLNSV